MTVHSFVPMAHQLLALAFSVFALGIAPNVAAQTTEDRADALFQQGKAAAEAKDWQHAHQLLVQAWQLKQSYDIASNLGQVAFLLGKHAEAAQHVSFALRHFPATGDAEQKQKAQSLLDMARREVSSFKIHVSREEAEVLIDGGRQGVASNLPPELFVEPGEHTVTARFGSERVQRDIDARAGQGYRIELVLGQPDTSAPAASPVRTAPGSFPAEPGRGSLVADTSPSEPGPALEARSVALIAGGVLTLASGVALGIYAVKRSRAASDVDTYQARAQEDGPGTNPCAGDSPSSDCRALADAASDWESTGRARNILLGTTVVLGVATAATFLLWPESKSGSEASALPSVAPVLDAEQQGVMLTGSF